MGFFDSKRVMVTGGNGFLGTFLVRELQQAGCRDVFIPRYPEYDLVKMKDVVRSYDQGRPEIVIHLAAVVGGLGQIVQTPGASSMRIS